MWVEILGGGVMAQFEAEGKLIESRVIWTDSMWMEIRGDVMAQFEAEGKLIESIYGDLD